jgi:hypothetical protein
MKKCIISCLVAFALMYGMVAGIPAVADSAPVNTIVKIGDYNNANAIKRKELSSNFNQQFNKGNMLTFEGNKDELDKSKVYADIGITNGFTTSSIDNEAKAMDNNLVGLSLQNVNGTTYVDEYYLIKDNKTDSDINNYVIQRSNDHIIKSDTSAKTFTICASADSTSNNDNYDYSRYYSWYDSSTLACSLQTTKTFTRAYKSNVSVWGVVSADTSI